MMNLMYQIYEGGFQTRSYGNGRNGVLIITRARHAVPLRNDGDEIATPACGGLAMTRWCVARIVLVVVVGTGRGDLARIPLRQRGYWQRRPKATMLTPLGLSAIIDSIVDPSRATLF